MRYIFNFPDIGEGLDEGTILEWYVTKGQPIKAGQALVKMETDKVVTDIPSPKNGIIVATFGAVDDVIHVGNPLVEIEIEGVFGAEAIAEAQAPLPGSEAAHTETVEEEGAGVVGTLEVAGSGAILAASDEGSAKNESERIQTRKALATPLARALARELNIDINQVAGTGPSGRVTRTDIENHKAASGRGAKTTVYETFLSSETPDMVTYEPLTQIRKAIARNMLNSKLNAAHMSLFEEVEISDLIRIKDRYKDNYVQKGAKLTYLPFVVKATANALKQHRQLNAQMDTENDRMIYKNYYHIAIAVDTPDGLVVPVIRNADRLSLMEIAQKISELSAKARNRQLTLEDMKDGTFTITSFGSIGGIFATPVINFPQTGILGIGRILTKPVVKNDQITVGHVMPLSLSVDHRVVDGGEVSRFINTLMKYLSDPVLLMME